MTPTPTPTVPMVELAAERGGDVHGILASLWLSGWFLERRPAAELEVTELSLIERRRRGYEPRRARLAHVREWLEDEGAHRARATHQALCDYLLGRLRSGLDGSERFDPTAIAHLQRLTSALEPLLDELGAVDGAPPQQPKVGTEDHRGPDRLAALELGERRYACVRSAGWYELDKRGQRVLLSDLLAGAPTQREEVVSAHLEAIRLLAHGAWCHAFELGVAEGASAGALAEIRNALSDLGELGSQLCDAGVEPPALEAESVA